MTEMRKKLKPWQMHPSLSGKRNSWQRWGDDDFMHVVIPVEIAAVRDAIDAALVAAGYEVEEPLCKGVVEAAKPWHWTFSGGCIRLCDPAGFVRGWLEFRMATDEEMASDERDLRWHWMTPTGYSEWCSALVEAADLLIDKMGPEATFCKGFVDANEAWWADWKTYIEGCREIAKKAKTPEPAPKWHWAFDKSNSRITLYEGDAMRGWIDWFWKDWSVESGEPEPTEGTILWRAVYDDGKPTLLTSATGLTEFMRPDNAGFALEQKCVVQGGRVQAWIESYETWKARWEANILGRRIARVKAAEAASAPEKPICNAVQPGTGFVCTLDADHDGKHRATTAAHGAGRIVGEWSCCCDGCEQEGNVACHPDNGYNEPCDRWKAKTTLPAQRCCAWRSTTGDAPDILLHFRCDLPLGHTGAHVHYDVNGVEVCRWVDDSKIDPNPCDLCVVRRPHRCPICNGNGTLTTIDWRNPTTETCPVCKGARILWG